MNFNLIFKKYIKPVLFIGAGLFIIYWMIFLFTPKPQIPLEYKHALDSLNRVSIELAKKQKQSDSIINLYQIKVDEVDFKIKNIKEKTTIVREYYHEKTKEVNKYTPSQIDSFFKNRYNY
jgi:hypothetical protein